MNHEITREPLGEMHFVYCSPQHRFTTDTMLLAHFAAPKPQERCLDVGTGCGLIPLLWAIRGQGKRILALELQEDAAKLAERSVMENNFAEKITVQQGDARDYRALLPHQGLSLIACNPPYFAQNTGAVRAGAEGVARHDETLTLKDLAELTRYSLKDGGRLCICFPCERMGEAMSIFTQHGLEPKRLRLVQSAPQKSPYLFLLECRKAGKTGLSVELPLIIAEQDGTPTPELETIYKL